MEASLACSDNMFHSGETLEREFFEEGGAYPAAEEFFEEFPEMPPAPAEPAVLDEPLYPGANLSVGDSLIAILTFFQSEHLTGASLSKLLSLIQLHLPEPNKFVSTTYLFFKSLERVDNEFSMSFYCSVCWGPRASMDDICTSCTDKKRSVNYFISLSMKDQIKKLYSRPGFLETIQYKNHRFKEDPDHIEDIYDGIIYKECEKTILADPKCISLTWNTDGVQIYECSTYSLWPFFFSVNELPFEERYKPENVILGGLWGCKHKPHPNVFLQNILLEVQELREQGLNVKLFDETEVNVKVPVILGTCDGPAKTTFFNFKPHSGYCSCPVCLINGEKSKRTGDVLVFPHEQDIALRTEENYREHLALASQNQQDSDVSKGVKGPTLLSSMLVTFMCLSTAIDSLHNCYLGLTKQLLNLWFNPCYHDQPFSLSKHVGAVNEKLMSLNLPHFVQRLPVGVDKLSYWKASLCRNFLFYFSLPVLKGTLKPIYYEHFRCFVEAITLLNSNSISPADLIKADELLQSFSEKFQSLYGLRHMSYNLHLLRHLTLIVSQTGNLWASSCFGFEDLNGKIANLAHGTRHAGLQIANNLSLLNTLPARVRNVSSAAVKKYCENLLSKGRRWNVTDKIMDYTYTVGDYMYFSKLNDTVAPLLQTLYGNTVTFQTFSRLLKNGLIYVAKTYTRGSRFSSYVKYRCNNVTSYGEIVTFVRACNPLGVNEYYAAVNVIQTIPFDVQHIFSVSVPDVSNVNLIPVKNILTVCFGFRVDDKLFICDPINTKEME